MTHSHIITWCFGCPALQPCGRDRNPVDTSGEGGRVVNDSRPPMDQLTQFLRTRRFCRSLKGTTSKTSGPGNHGSQHQTMSNTASANQKTSNKLVSYITNPTDKIWLMAVDIPEEVPNCNLVTSATAHHPEKGQTDFEDIITSKLPNVPVPSFWTTRLTVTKHHQIHCEW